MSRTKHHRAQKYVKSGRDFGARYKHNKGYGGGTGRLAKDAAHCELRRKDKLLAEGGVVDEVSNEDLGVYDWSDEDIEDIGL